MGNGDQKIHVAREKALIIEIPDTDFIFGADCDLMVHILQVNYPTVQLHINTNFTHKKQLYMELYTEVVDQPMNQKFVTLIFDPGGHFPNSRSSSFQAGQNDAATPIPDVRYIVGHM